MEMVDLCPSGAVGARLVHARCVRARVAAVQHDARARARAARARARNLACTSWCTLITADLFKFHWSWSLLGETAISNLKPFHSELVFSIFFVSLAVRPV